MGDKTTFTPDSFDDWQDTPEHVYSDSSLYETTKASLDAFLAQEHESGFFTEIEQTSPSSPDSAHYVTNDEPKDNTLRELGELTSSSNHARFKRTRSDERGERSARNEQSACALKHSKKSVRNAGSGDKAFAVVASERDVVMDNADVPAELLNDDVLVEEHVDTYVPSDNPVINEIHDHMVAHEPLSDEEKNFIGDIVTRKIEETLSFFGERNVRIDEYETDDHSLIFDIFGDDLAVLIGHHGHTLDALQSIINAFLSNALHFYYPISLDVEGYKERRKEKIQAIALSAAARAKRRGCRVVLAPMSPADRRLVHIALINDTEVTTHSEGYEPNRRVVVTAVRRRKHGNREQ